MTYEANQKYSTVITAAGLIESNGGTPGIELILKNDEHGEMVHRMWLTEKTKARTAKTLAEFGISEAEIPAFLAANCRKLIGMTASIETEEDSYNGETRVRAKWLNGPQRQAREIKPATPKAASAAARLFGAADSDDLPF